MKKGILVVLLVLLAFTVWTVLAFGKATNKENLQQPTQIQKAEPGPEAFPAVVLPKAKPTKPTTEDFQKLMLEKKGITPAMLEQRKLENVPAEDFEALKEPLTLCTIGNQQLPCCYRSTNDNTYLRCWGEVGTATYIDPDNQGYGMVACPYPLYPFNATAVAMALNTDDTCTVVFRPEIWSVVFIDGLPYPNAPIFVGPEYTRLAIGGTWTEYLSLGADVCLYEPWFAVMAYVNTDDRYDPAYCPSGNTIPAYQSWIYDIAGRPGQSYWNPYGLGGSWYDVVPNGICSGAIRVRTQGYNQPENTCTPPVDPWYFKDPQEPLAPFGVPDFDQHQMPPAFCGPTAEANSYWYFAAKGLLPANPPDVPTLINQIAVLAGTDPVLGTNCDALGVAILQLIKNNGGWNFVQNTVYAPDFWYLQKALRACEDKVLLLGFWQEDPPGTWNRFGGHFVTLSGIDIFNLAFAFSDPAIDNKETGGGPGQVLGIHNPPADPLDHNSGVVSYDYYSVAWPSASPGGLLWLPDYIVPWPLFQNQNAGPMPNTGTYNSALPVHVEVEQAIDVYPGTKYSNCEVWAPDGDLDVTCTNYGRIGPQTDYDFWFGGADQLYDGGILMGTSGSDMAVSVMNGIGYEPYGLCTDVWDTVLYEEGPDSLIGYVLRSSYKHLYLPIDINQTVYIFDWKADPADPINSVALHEYDFTNTGATALDVREGLFFDWDVALGGAANLGGGDSALNTIWQTDDVGMILTTLVPEIVGQVAPYAGVGEQNDYLYPDIPSGPYDSVYALMGTTSWEIPSGPPPTFDYGTLMAGPLHLDPSVPVHYAYFLWGYQGLPDDTVVAKLASPAKTAWKNRLFYLLKWKGYYRGDANCDGKMDVSDVIYMINYLFKSGPAPKPLKDQMDVNNDVANSVTDVITAINYLFKGGAPFIDKDRFSGKARTSLFVDPQWKDLGKQ